MQSDGFGRYEIFVGVIFASWVSYAPAVFAESRGDITSQRCPYSCRGEGLPQEVCRDWRKGDRCFIEDFRTHARLARVSDPAGGGDAGRMRGLAEQLAADAKTALMSFDNDPSLSSDPAVVRAARDFEKEAAALPRTLDAGGGSVGGALSLLQDRAADVQREMGRLAPDKAASDAWGKVVTGLGDLTHAYGAAGAH